MITIPRLENSFFPREVQKHDGALAVSIPENLRAKAEGTEPKESMMRSMRLLDEYRVAMVEDETDSEASRRKRASSTRGRAPSR